MKVLLLKNKYFIKVDLNLGLLALKVTTNTVDLSDSMKWLVQLHKESNSIVPR